MFLYWIVFLLTVSFYVKYQLVNLKPQEQLTLIVALGVKFVAAIILGVVYSVYYAGGDTFYLFDRAHAYYQVFLDAPLEYCAILLEPIDTQEELFQGIFSFIDRAELWVKMISVLLLITGGSYWLTALYLALFSFWGTWKLVLVLKRVYPQSWLEIVFCWLLFPSVVFWTSGLMKETFFFGSFNYALAIFLRWYFYGESNWALSRVLLLLLLVFFSFKLKYYYWSLAIACSVPLVVISLVLRKYDVKLKYIFCAYVVFLGLGIVIALQTHENFEPNRLLSFVLQNRLDLLPKLNPAYMIDIPNQINNYYDLLLNTPHIIVQGLLRPHLGEVYNIPVFGAAIENTFILLLLLFSIKLKWGVTYTKKDYLMLVSVMIYSGGLLLFLTLSTPSLGSLSRYKISFLPLLLFFLCQQSQLLARFHK